ncbi:class F sortase [Nocardioides cynanchi]|uniref:class F sortase n=1 Tax=Nocardioides cynanchi TaxID=2558918 RepID=UPI001243FCC2|nr:class F sortase [Nocardioides cynanchi]
MSDDHGWSLGRRSGLTLAAVAVAAALVLLVIVIRAQVSAPEPHAAGRIDVPTSGPTGHHRSSSDPATQAAPPLGPSKPVHLRIPAIGVDTSVFPIGLASDGTLAVPQPGPRLNTAAWFENSPTPGQPGPSIIEGHVDSVDGPSVFLKLGDIKPGDRIIVQRADGRTVTFEVNAVRDFLKSEFPTNLVYGGDQLSQPTLRLITCSDYDPSIQHHVGNEVVFAHLVHASGSTTS